MRGGGIFHVVTRAAGNSLSHLRDEREEMLVFAEHGPVRLEDLVLIPYQEPVSGGRIGVAAPGSWHGDGDRFAASAIFRIDQTIRQPR